MVLVIFNTIYNEDSMDKEISLLKHYDAELSTFKFILLTILTLGFYYFYWLLSFVKKFNQNYSTPAISVTLILIMIIIGEWSSIFIVDPSEYSLYTPEEITGLGMLTGFLVLVNIALSIYIAVAAKNPIEATFKGAGYNIRLSLLCVIFFQFFYYYYVTHNSQAISSKNNLREEILRGGK